jgi:hypothetical protein
MQEPPVAKRNLRRQPSALTFGHRFSLNNHPIRGNKRPAMPAQLHQTRASAGAVEFVGRNALMALPIAAVAAVCLYRGLELRALGSQILVFGAGGLLAALAAALAVTRQRLTLALGSPLRPAGRDRAGLAGRDHRSHH